MDTITLRPDLQSFVEKNAGQQSKTVSDIVNEALEHYAEEQSLRKLDQEIKAYELLHPQLKEKLFGEWVAVHEQKLVDHDQDGGLLYKRIREKYGSTAVLIRQVEEQPSREIWLRTFSTGRLP